MRPLLGRFGIAQFAVEADTRMRPGRGQIGQNAVDHRDQHQGEDGGDTEPANTTQPMARLASTPGPEPKINGKAPSTVDNIVIIAGRRRVMAATYTASIIEAPRSRN